MFTVIYRFEVHPGQEGAFRQSWKALTELILEHRNSLGSRLHKSDKPHEFIAYAQWHNQTDWETNGNEDYQKLAKPVGEQMRAACSAIETLHTMTTTDDLLVHSSKG